MDKSPKPPTRALETEIEIAAPVEAVWKALTDARELANWFPLEAGENPDGTVWMAWRNDYKWTSRIEISEPPRHLRTVSVEDVMVAEQPEGENKKSETITFEPTATDVYLEARGGKTVLRLVHSGFSTATEWDELYDATRRGWNFQLWSLQHYLTKHRGTPRITAYVRQLLSKLTREQAWQRLMTPDFLLQAGKLENLKPGDRYSFRTASGDSFEGVIQTFNPPLEIYGTVENFNHGIFEIHLDELFGYRDVMFQLSTYGVPREQVEGVEARMQKLLRRLNDE